MKNQCKTGGPVVARYKFNGRTRIIYGKLHSVDGTSWVTVEVQTWNDGKKGFDFLACRKYNVKDCTQEEVDFYNKQVEGWAKEPAAIK